MFHACFFLLPWGSFSIYTLCAPRSFYPLAFCHSLLHPELHRVSYLPPPAFFIPSSVPLTLHHYCLHRQRWRRRRQWRRSHYGHLSDSISVICKSSSGVTGIISPCVLQVKGWPICVCVCVCLCVCLHAPSNASAALQGERMCAFVRYRGADITASLSAAGSDWSRAWGQESNIVLNWDLLSSDPRAQCVSMCVCEWIMCALVCFGSLLCTRSLIGRECTDSVWRSVRAVCFLLFRNVFNAHFAKDVTQQEATMEKEMWR